MILTGDRRTALFCLTRNLMWFYSMNLCHFNVGSTLWKPLIFIYFPHTSFNKIHSKLIWFDICRSNTVIIKSAVITHMSAPSFDRPHQAEKEEGGWRKKSPPWTPLSPKPKLKTFNFYFFNNFSDSSWASLCELCVWK